MNDTKFLSKCYDTVCEIHEKRLATSKAAREADQDNSKNCQTEKEKMQKDQACRSADRLLQQQQKTKKPMPPFDKDNFKTYAGLPPEDAERSESNLIEKKTDCLVKIKKCDDANISLKTERKPFDEKITELQTKLDGDLNEAEFKDVKLSLEYYELKIKKIETKIEKSEEEKANIQTQLDGLEKRIDILTCVLDHQNLLHEVKNFHDRKTRVIERMRKILQDRDALNATRENLNKLWQELTRPKEPEKKPVSIFSQDKPIKPEEICQPLTLKSEGEFYFI